MRRKRTETTWIDVRTLRLERGWSSTTTAEKLGISPGYLSRIENTECQLSSSMIAKITSLFDLKTVIFNKQ